MTAAAPRYRVVALAYAVAFMNARGDELVAVSEHPTAETAKAEAARLNARWEADKAKVLATATAPAWPMRRPVRRFECEETGA